MYEGGAGESERGRERELQLDTGESRRGNTKPCIFVIFINLVSIDCSRDCTGLKRCHRETVDSCCNYFDMTGSCTAECPVNSGPDDSFTCSCQPGNIIAGHGCVEMDECWSNPCLNGGNCTNLVNNFTCACVAGFTGDTCATNIDDCDPLPCEMEALVRT